MKAQCLFYLLAYRSLVIITMLPLFTCYKVIHWERCRAAQSQCAGGTYPLIHPFNGVQYFPPDTWGLLQRTGHRGGGLTALPATFGAMCTPWKQAVRPVPVQGQGSTHTHTSSTLPTMSRAKLIKRSDNQI